MSYPSASDGTRLFYTDVGRGAPVFAVHSWSLSSALWENPLPVLADRHADRPAWFRNGTDAYFVRPSSGVSQAIADDGVGRRQR